MFISKEKSGLTLPEWTEHVYPEKLLNYAIKALEIETVDTEISRLSTGIKFYLYKIKDKQFIM